MSGRFWIKLYHEILDDPKMGKLSDHLWRRAVELFLLAGRKGTDGTLPAICDLAWALRDVESEVVADLINLSQFNVTSLGDDGSWSVTHFQERQDKDTPSERKANQRKVEKRDMFVTNPVTLSDTEIEIESELKLKQEIESSESYFFNQVQIVTGLLATANDIQVIEKWEKDGATMDDIRDAMQWRVDNGKGPVKIISYLAGGVEMARLKRIQGKNGKKASDQQTHKPPSSAIDASKYAVRISK
jgi:hypothetical protein